MCCFFFFGKFFFVIFHIFVSVFLLWQFCTTLWSFWFSVGFVIDVTGRSVRLLSRGTVPACSPLAQSVIALSRCWNFLLQYLYRLLYCVLSTAASEFIYSWLRHREDWARKCSWYRCIDTVRKLRINNNKVRIRQRTNLALSTVPNSHILFISHLWHIGQLL